MLAETLQGVDGAFTIETGQAQRIDMGLGEDVCRNLRSLGLIRDQGDVEADPMADDPMTRSSSKFSARSRGSWVFP